MIERPTSELMTVEDIAEMHRCTFRRARDVIVKIPGFPPEAPTSTPRNRLWLRSDVVAFVRGKFPHKSRTNPAQANFSQ